MIEEIKMLLDAVGDVADLGLWALLAFVVYKLVIYLSTTGAIVFCIRLAIERIHQILIAKNQRRLREAELEKAPQSWDMGGLPFEDSVRKRLERAIKEAHEHRSPNLNYMHNSDADWLAVAVKEKIERERQEASCKTKS